MNRISQGGEAKEIVGTGGKKVLLVGAGPMAIEYAKVLKSLKVNFITVGRGQKSAENFSKIIGKSVVIGGIKEWVKKMNLVNALIPAKAIVAVSENELGKSTLELINQGVPQILVEKPGGFNENEIKKIAQKAKQKKITVFVGYNRRFYASVLKAKQIIKRDGGVKSFYFDFTERSYIIADLKKAPGVKQKWFLHNSTHVIDLAFFLGGWPKKIESHVSDKLSWHPKGAIFTGSGITKNKTLFSYHANWKAPGGWALEIYTKKHKLIFRPMEKLQVQKLGSMEIKEAKFDDNLDIKFKPGIYRQTRAFLFGKKAGICLIDEQKDYLKTYGEIIGKS